MDRASDFGSEGWGFESLRAHRTRPARVLVVCSVDGPGVAFGPEDRAAELLSGTSHASLLLSGFESAFSSLSSPRCSLRGAPSSPASSSASTSSRTSRTTGDAVAGFTRQSHRWVRHESPVVLADLSCLISAWARFRHCQACFRAQARSLGAFSALSGVFPRPSNRRAPS